MGLAGLSVALGGPILGWLADRTSPKPFLGFFSLVCFFSILFCWTVLPDPQYTVRALFLAGLGSASLEFAYIFYNAMLPEIAPQEQIGKWSGWGWGAGYLGGVLSLSLCLLFLENVRAMFLFAAAWYAVFALPLLLFVPAQTYMRQKGSIRPFLLFLLARLFFNDGLLTLFTFGGIYAASTFNMSGNTIIFFGLSLNVSAGIGAALFSWIDDRIGAKKTILISLTGLLILSTLALLADQERLFWLAALVLGLFVGPAQASSRSYMARMTPPHLRNQMFGFFALSARITQFLGPLLISWLTYWTGNMRIGMSGILFLLLVGLILMLSVKSDKIVS